ncbi:DUF2254 domain-containing protein [Streptomyces sp. NPDC001401]|uniref:DUF2254 domain-containing protein n=1 Tax=Streptomyces sp. NPDC001401 TaxID=3364570 RepID=UPI00369E7AD3
MEAEPWHTRGPVATPRFRRLVGLLSPALATATMVAAVVLGLGLPHWEDSLPKVGLTYDPATASTTLAAIAGGMITLSGFVITAVTLVIQTVQSMSPRLIGVIGHFRRSVAVVGLVTGTAVYALVVLAQIRPDETPRLSVTLAVALVVVDTAVLLRSLTRLRQFVTGGGLARAVGELMPASIDAALPLNGTAAAAGAAEAWASGTGVPLVHTGRPGVVQGVDERRLVRIATGWDARVALGVGPGDYVGAGSVLGYVHGPAEAREPHGGRLRLLASCVHVDRVRSLGQDPSYGLRLLVDIAIRALSPAVNDPTTAVQALDQIEETLLRLVTRPLGVALVTDDRGTPRLRRSAPVWPGLVSLALDEILHYGATSLQVVRRLRVLLDTVAEAAPDHRRAPLAERVALVDRLAHSFRDPLLTAVAEGADRQGLGGPTAP